MRAEYAVVLYFDDRTNSIFQNMIDKIAEITGNRYMTDNGIPPHITIGDLLAEEVPDISELASEIKSGEILFGGLGSFGERVLYAAPDMNDHLRECSRAAHEFITTRGYEENPLYSGENWIPHLTIATRLDSKQLRRALAAAEITPFCGRSEKVALVKCDPYRDVNRYIL